MKGLSTQASPENSTVMETGGMPMPSPPYLDPILKRNVKILSTAFAATVL